MPGKKSNTIDGRVLPPWMAHKNGRYYYLRKAQGKVSWIKLTSDFETSYEQYKSLLQADGKKLSDVPFSDKEFQSYCAQMVRVARFRAAKKSMPFEISLDWMLAECERQGNRCALTGIPFRMSRTEARNRPFAPSIDRISSFKGYTTENSRVICLAVNLALNQWGDSTFAEIAEGFLLHGHVNRLRSLARKPDQV